MTNYIYSRVSTGLQDNVNQTSRLREQYPDAVVVEEVASGGKSRPELEKLIERLLPGDHLIVSSLDRLGRKAAEVILLVEELDRRGVILKSLRENIDFSTLAGRFVFQILAALGEMERRLISERTKAALAVKKKQGVQLGRPPKYPKKVRDRVRSLRLDGMTLKSIAEEVGISLSSIQSLLNR